MPDPYLEARKDLDRIKRLLQRLHRYKEQEISMCRVGKRIPASTVKEMREMEATIEAVMNRRSGPLNTQQKNLFDSFKNGYVAQMRSWKNRLANAERQRFRRNPEAGHGKWHME